MRLNELQRIHLIHYCHQDHAWTCRRSWHKQRYLEYFDRLLAVMRKDPERTALIDNFAHGLVVMANYRQECMDELRAFVREGRVELADGGYALPRLTTCPEELFIRNLLKGMYNNRALLDSTSKVFINADTAVGHSQLPQLLKLTGHELYRFFRPLGALDYKGVPREFIWKGLDGSKVYVTRGDYGSHWNCEYQRAEHATDEQRLDAFVREEIDTTLPLQQSRDLLLFSGGDDSLPECSMQDDELPIEQIRRTLERHGGPELRYSTIRNYLDAVKAQPLPEWSGPVDNCELAYAVPMRGYESMWQRRNWANAELLRLERLLCLIEQQGGTSDFSLVEALWDRVFGFTGHALDALLDEDYRWMLQHSGATLFDIRRMTEQAMDQLCALSGAGTDSILCVNTADFSSEPVQMEISSAGNMNGFTLQTEDGTEIPYQLIHANDCDHRFPKAPFTHVDVVADLWLTPLSARVVRVVRTDEDLLERVRRSIHPELAMGERMVLGDGALQVVLRDGVIQCVVHNGVCVFDGATQGGFGEPTLYETESTRDWTMGFELTRGKTFTATRSVCPERGPIRWRYISDGLLGDIPARVCVTVVKDVERIDFQLELLSGSRPVEGYIALGFPCDERCAMFAGIPFGMEERAPESEPYGADIPINMDNPSEAYLFMERGIRGLFHARHFTSCLLSREPMAILQGDCGVYWRRTDAGRRIEMLLTKGYIREAREGWASEIYPFALGETPSTFECAAAFPGRLDDCARLTRMDQALSHPVLCAHDFFDKGHKRAGGKPPALESNTECLVLSAMYKDGRRHTVRLFNASGDSGVARVRINLDFERALLCDLTGSGTRVIPRDADGWLEIEYEPWMILNLALESVSGEAKEQI